MYFSLIPDPQGLLTGFHNGSQIKVSARKIAGYGLGGSGIILRLLNDLFPSLPFRFLTWNDSPSDERFTIFISYSGETPEVIEMAKKWQGSKNVCVITSGGRLLEWAEQNHIPFVRLSAGFLPRFAYYEMLGAVLGIIHSQDSALHPEHLFSTVSYLHTHLHSMVEAGKHLAEKWEVSGRRIPVIWGIEGITGVVAYRWRTQINENAKMLSISHQLPESAHNELAALSAEVFPIFLITDFDPPFHVRQREILQKMLERLSCPPQLVVSDAPLRISALLSLIVVGDAFSLSLAKLLGKDPIAIPLITHLRKEMSSR
ncbi:MAG: SIS domain-containing protein [bacterium JZ-2024 1]